MKNSIIRNILAVVTMLSLFLACAEANSVVAQILWSSSCLLVCGISGKAFTKYLTEEEKEERV
jgi:hypothetical protein